MQREKRRDDCSITRLKIPNVMRFILNFQTSVARFMAVTAHINPVVTREVAMKTLRSSSPHSMVCNTVIITAKKHLHPKVYTFSYFRVAGKHTLRIDMTVLLLTPVPKRRSLCSSIASYCSLVNYVVNDSECSKTFIYTFLDHHHKGFGRINIRIPFS